MKTLILAVLTLLITSCGEPYQGKLHVGDKFRTNRDNPFRNDTVTILAISQGYVSFTYHFAKSERCSDPVKRFKKIFPIKVEDDN